MKKRPIADLEVGCIFESVQTTRLTLVLEVVGPAPDDYEDEWEREDLVLCRVLNPKKVCDEYCLPNVIALCGTEEVYFANPMEVLGMMAE